MRNTTTTVVIAAGAVLAASTQAATIYVDAANCPGPGDGSIGDPYCSIQTAITNAVDTDEVIVAEGTYSEAINLLGKAVTLRSTDPLDPIVVANTIIDAGGSGSAVTFGNSEGANTVLSGFLVTGGNDFSGGGMTTIISSPTVTNCIFTGNATSGMVNVFSSPTVTNCTFTENTATVGGGINNFDSSPTVTGCTFTGNSASDGGGMFTNGGIPTVTNCTFCDNTPNAISGPYADGGGNNLLCPDGACCVVDSCLSLQEANCIAAGGTYQGHATTCQASSCPGFCPADIDGDGTVGINDFLDLLAAWGPCK